MDELDREHAEYARRLRLLVLRGSRNMDDLEDVWNLPVREHNDPCPTPQEEQLTSQTCYGTRHTWEAEYLANKHHDCTYCRMEICPSEYYYRIAIPMHTHVVVLITCTECYRP